MVHQLGFLQRLSLEQDADERAIRRAYARELKRIDQEADPAGFQSLREAYEHALLWTRHQARSDVADHGAKQVAAAPASTANGRDDTAEAGPMPAAQAVPQTDVSAPRLQPAFPGVDMGAAEVLHPGDRQSIDHDALATTVFTEFMGRAAIAGDAAVTDDAAWTRELRGSLADVRLVNMEARNRFEWLVAAQLAQGWQPGHEALFIAAIAVFEWERDRGRILALGRAGAMLDDAIDQRAMYYQQPYNESEPQRRLIQRLRSTQTPTTRELLRYHAPLTTLTERFPAWIAVITDVGNIAHWHALDGQLPAWRRRLRRLRPTAAPRSDKSPSRGISGVWLICVLIWGLSHFYSAFHSHGESGSDAPAEPPATPAETLAKTIDRGNKLMEENDFDGAVDAFDRAIELDSQSAATYALRGAAYTGKHDVRRATEDFNRSAELDPQNPLLYRGRGKLDYYAGRYTEAVAAFSRALALEPGSLYAQYWLIASCEKAGLYDKALAGADEYIQRHPDAIDVYRIRFRVFRALKETAKAAAQSASIVAANPSNAAAYEVAAGFQSDLGNVREAIEFIDQGIAVKPDPGLYADRADFRPKSDFARRRTDLNAAFRLAPHAANVLLQRAELELDAGRYQAAADAYTLALAEKTTHGAARGRLLAGRGIALSKLGAGAAAQADFTAAGQAATTPAALNDVCWYLATRNAALESALTLCEAALVDHPEFAYGYDSKAFVLLRLGRYHESVTAYDMALALQPAMAGSLFGRGVAKRRLGDLQGSKADLDTAKTLAPKVVENFAGFGVVP